jgi:hypothetical protein
MKATFMEGETNVSKDSIAYKEFVALAAKFGGWVDGKKLRFPTVDAKDRFERANADAHA